MPGEGVEPSWTYVHTILSRARLPIPPPGPDYSFVKLHSLLLHFTLSCLGLTSQKFSKSASSDYHCRSAFFANFIRFFYKSLLFDNFIIFFLQIFFKWPIKFFDYWHPFSFSLGNFIQVIFHFSREFYIHNLRKMLG